MLGPIGPRASRERVKARLKLPPLATLDGNNTAARWLISRPHNS
jgi:hypothetical protein